VVIYLVTRIFAIRAERISDELTEKMSTVLEKDQAVTFSWTRPEELRVLGNTLTCLAEKHAEDTRALRRHAQALEDSNRYKSEFLANVSHELRTPLNSILLLSKMLAREDAGLSSENRQQARVIHDAGVDLRSLIDTILDLSRIEAGKAALNTSRVDLVKLLEDLTALMRPQFEEKGLRLDLVIDADAPSSAFSDIEKLRQIVINFLSNALKFTESGHCILRLAKNKAADARSLPASISVAQPASARRQRHHGTTLLRRWPRFWAGVVFSFLIDRTPRFRPSTKPTPGTKSPRKPPAPEPARSGSFRAGY